MKWYYFTLMGVNTLNGRGRKLRFQGRYLAPGLGEGRGWKNDCQNSYRCVFVCFSCRVILL